MKSLVFLSGLPRTGTTVLSSILNQNPKIHCTSTSGLLDFLSGVDSVYCEVTQRYKTTNITQLENIFKSICSSYYKHIPNDIVIDKWRGWVANIPQIKTIITDTPKIICTYRPIEEIVTSFLYLLEKDPSNFVDEELQKNNLKPTNFNRANYLWNVGVVGETYNMFLKSLPHKDTICYISYNDIVYSTEKTISKIYRYLGLEFFDHTYTNLNNRINDNDEFWRIKNLHTIRKTLGHEYKNPEDFIDQNLLNKFKQLNSVFSKLPT